MSKVDNHKRTFGLRRELVRCYMAALDVSGLGENRYMDTDGLSLYAHLKLLLTARISHHILLYYCWMNSYTHVQMLLFKVPPSFGTVSHSWASFHCIQLPNHQQIALCGPSQAASLNAPLLIPVSVFRQDLLVLHGTSYLGLFGRPAFDCVTTSVHWSPEFRTLSHMRSRDLCLARFSCRPPATANCLPRSPAPTTSHHNPLHTIPAQGLSAVCSLRKQ